MSDLHRDQAMEDTKRELSGAFYTPLPFAAEARRHLDAALGENWKEECIVWDPAAGSCALTREADFTTLISTTLDAEDVELMRELGMGGTTAQVDFLNYEYTEYELPNGIEEILTAGAAAGKRLVFFVNPPYATSGVAGTTSRSKAGVSKTLARSEMKENKLGRATNQLYAQFMFRMVEIAKSFGFKDWTVAIFNKPGWTGSSSFRALRNYWYSQHQFESGFMFRASHFQGVSGKWGVLFTVWNSSETPTPSDALLPIELQDIKDGEAKAFGTRLLYNSNDREASKWVREPIKGLKGSDAPQFKSGLNPQPKGEGRCGTLGFWANHANSMQHSGTLVFLLSSAYQPGLRNGGGVLEPANFRRAVALYAARKLVPGDWVNDENEYLAPTTEPPHVSSGLKVGHRKSPYKLAEGCLGVMNNHANNVMKSGTEVCLLSTATTLNASVPLLPENWRRSIALYGARKLIPSEWHNREDEYLAPTTDAPQMSSGLKVKEGPGCRGTLAPGALYYLTNVANCPHKSGTDVFSTSSCSSMAHGLSVTPANFRHVIALYGARKLVKDNWIIHEDEYLAPTGDTPKFSSGLKVRDNGTAYPAGSVPGTMGVMCNMSNNVMKSGTDVYFLSGKPTHKGYRHFDILPDNWRRSVALYSARKLVKDNWTIREDEYLAPAAPTTPYEAWVNDCHVYAILHNNNNCTAMRDVPYKGKAWTISNHLFWLPRAFALECLDTPDTQQLLQDCLDHPAGYVVPKAPGSPVAPWEFIGDPYMAEVLSDMHLSPEAEEVLWKITDLWIKSLPVRESFAESRPELHLAAWDAGIYQLKHLWREMFPEEWADLQVSFKALSEKLRPGVYEHGFLLDTVVLYPEGEAPTP